MEAAIYRTTSFSEPRAVARLRERRGGNPHLLSLTERSEIETLEDEPHPPSDRADGATTTRRRDTSTRHPTNPDFETPTAPELREKPDGSWARTNPERTVAVARSRA
ncbi:hypothetical protein [Halorussus salinisoli]|uniref:hypothetical protein n=1 Tax=Halorussus salinisoli TaxID=2558242 RepID=UPI0010C1DE96|nr:hypothetical protein [Halorussus salinisoli]